MAKNNSADRQHHVVFHSSDFKNWEVWKDLVETLGKNPCTTEALEIWVRLDEPVKRHYLNGQVIAFLPDKS